MRRGQGTFYCYCRLSKGAFSNSEPIKLSVVIQNSSTVDVSGASVKVGSIPLPKNSCYFFSFLPTTTTTTTTTTTSL